jgi:hypothetical protein
MTLPETEQPARSNHHPLAAILAGLGGGALGFLAGRGAGSAIATTIETLSTALVRHTALSTAGPVIATGVTAAAVILAATVIPAVVAWTLTRKEHDG